MNTYSEKSRELYLAYTSLDPSAYRQRVRFYEEHLDLLAGLSYDERMQLELDYHFSLFEIGKYQRFLDSVDPLIEAVIIDNIRSTEGDFFVDLLFKKAASCYNLWRLPECEQIVCQLLKIDRNYPNAPALYLQCRLKAKRSWYEIVKALSVVAFFVGASLLLVAHLVVDPFHPAYFPTSKLIANVLLISCVVLLIVNELSVRYAAVLDLRQQIR